ncbi:hypothetical protein [Parasphingorhabdus sp.]|uniref:hypothetical protein n=1 Tax=Parasphingorhabdus sp. TaxID=2709688 RepID=UPI0030019BB0
MTQSDKFVMSPGDVYHLDKAFLKAGYKPADITALRKGTMATAVLEVLRGKAKIEATEHVIDCSKVPKVPEAYEWEPALSTFVTNRVVWNASDVCLKTTGPNQKTLDHVSGHLSKLPVTFLPVNVMEYLLDNQELIPAEWNGKCVFFFDVAYVSHQAEHRNQTLYRCMYQILRKGFWTDGRRFLSDEWDHDRDRVALIKL